MRIPYHAQNQQKKYQKPQTICSVHISSTTSRMLWGFVNCFTRLAYNFLLQMLIYVSEFVLSYSRVFWFFLLVSCRLLNLWCEMAPIVYLFKSEIKLLVFKINSEKTANDFLFFLLNEKNNFFFLAPFFASLMLSGHSL